ncbi:MAG: linear amide C-N hydrolase [Acidobacteria bacterium]|nr:linear amide C-N hydrolase [Acidobacteriota bacterium]
MNWRIFPALIVACFLAAFPHVGGACSAFLIGADGASLMAKNYDWHLGNGLLMINNSGVEKVSMVAEGQTPVEWVSKFGSLTFNQYGRELPNGGMNEAGLAMEVMWLEATSYPPPGDLPSIGVLQWVQYCLDRFETVEEVAASASALAVDGIANLHYLACDARSRCAVIEFLEGEASIRSGRSLPVPALTNNTYSSSLAFLNGALGYGGEVLSTEGQGSLQRFARVATAVNRSRAHRPEDPLAAALATLADVTQTGRGGTKWSIVYDLGNRVVHFRTSSNPKLRTIRLEGLELDCPGPPLMLGLDAPLEGDVTSELQVFSAEANLDLIRSTFGGTAFLGEERNEMIRAVADYPQGLVCTLQAEDVPVPGSAP